VLKLFRSRSWLVASGLLVACTAVDRTTTPGGPGAGASGGAGRSDAGAPGSPGAGSGGQARGGAGGLVGEPAGGGAGAASGAPGAGGVSGASGAAGNEPVEHGAGAPAASFIIGADITWVQADEAAGATYSDGTPRDILQILKDHGFNYIRLRTFVDPRATDGYDKQHGYADLAHTISFGQRIKAAGLGFLLDFHYSDNWADPGKQCVPVAWRGFTDVTQMANAVHAYTASTLSALIAAGARPDMVQVGNEITPGMDIHLCDADGKPTGTNPVSGSISDWTKLGALLRAGSNAVKEADPTILVMLHIDRGNELETSRDFISNAQRQGVVFDVFGESCYTAYQGQPSAWANTFTQLASAYPQLKFVIAEYGPEARAANDLLFALPDKRGLGSFVWEPTHAGSWNTGHTLFDAIGSQYTATPDLLLYDQMKSAYGSRL
jgi:arabinogalactan endo-1,4-beta-galactosidase